MLTRPRLARCPRRPGPHPGRSGRGRIGRPAEAEPRPIGCRREPGRGWPGRTARQSSAEADVAFLSAPQEADATVAANGTVTEERARTGRRACDRRVGPVVPAGQGQEEVRADPAGGPRRQRRARRRRGGPGTGRRRGDAGAPGTGRGARGEHAVWPGGRGRGRRPGDEASQERGGGRGRGTQPERPDWASQEQPEWVSPQEGTAGRRSGRRRTRPAAGGRAAAAGRASAAGRVGSAAGRMSALLRPGGAALASPPEGPVLAPSPEGPVLAPLPEGPGAGVAPGSAAGSPGGGCCRPA